MTRLLMTAAARDDLDALVRRAARGGPRAARRALDELAATMAWLADRPAEGGEEAAAEEAAALDGGARLWPYRDALLAWRPATADGARAAVVLRVLRRDGSAP